MYEQWVFRADGTGEVRFDSAMTAEKTDRFEWQRVRPGVLRVRVVDDDDPESDAWHEVAWQFAVHHHDVSSEVAMTTPGCSGFWYGQFPLALAR